MNQLYWLQKAEILKYVVVILINLLDRREFVSLKKREFSCNFTIKYNPEHIGVSNRTQLGPLYLCSIKFCYQPVNNLPGYLQKAEILKNHMLGRYFAAKCHKQLPFLANYPNHEQMKQVSKDIHSYSWKCHHVPRRIQNIADLLQLQV